MTIADIARLSGVSKATVSRVLNGSRSVRPEARERVQQIIQQYHYQPNVFARQLRSQTESLAPPFLERVQHHRAAKEAIAKEALTFVHDGMTVFLDAGSTTLALAHLLGAVNSLTIVTSSIAALQVLANSRHTLHVTGGQYVPALHALTGETVVQAYRRWLADVAFIGASGLSLADGIFCYDRWSWRIKRAMMRHSAMVVVLVDSSKINQHVSSACISPELLDYVITDDQVPLTLPSEETYPFKITVCRVANAAR